MHWLCYPDRKTDVERGLGCDLMLYLTRFLLLRSAAIAFPYQLSAAPSPSFPFTHSGQIRSSNRSPGRLFFFFLPPVRSAHWTDSLMVSSWMPCSAEEPLQCRNNLVFPQPIAMLQGERCAEEVARKQAPAKARSRLVSLALMGAVWWDCPQGVAMCLEGSTDSPCSQSLPPIFLHPRNVTSQALGLFLHNLLCQHWCISSGSSFCSWGEPTKELKENGFNNSPCWGEWKLSVWWRGKRTRWLQNYPWPQEGGLGWHLFWKVSYFEVTKSCFCAFPNSSQKRQCWNIRKTDLAVILLLWFADQRGLDRLLGQILRKFSNFLGAYQHDVNSSRNEGRLKFWTVGELVITSNWATVPKKLHLWSAELQKVGCFSTSTSEKMKHNN